MATESAIDLSDWTWRSTPLEAVPSTGTYTSNPRQKALREVVSTHMWVRTPDTTT